MSNDPQKPGYPSALLMFLDANNEAKYVSEENPLPGGGGGGGGGGAVTIADGANKTFGAMADPVLAQMDANPHTFMSYFKGAFQFLQNISTVVGNAFALMVTGTQLPATLGAKTSAGSISTVPASDSGLQPTPWTALSAAQLGGLAIALPNAGGLQLQFAGVSADSLLVEHTADGTNWKTALLARQDVTQVSLVSGAAVTGTTANAIYTVPLFGGQFRVTRTGTADASLTAGYRGTK